MKTFDLYQEPEPHKNLPAPQDFYKQQIIGGMQLTLEL
jgi:hypothetical protein